MINTNQPESAFPSTFKSMSPEEGQVHRWGMTLRDYFAAKAMQALIHDEAADPDCGSLSEWWADVDEKLIGPERFAVAAYMMADAMLRAREGVYD